MQLKLDWTAILAVAGLGGLAYFIWKYNPAKAVVEASKAVAEAPSEIAQKVQQQAVQTFTPLITTQQAAQQAAQTAQILENPFSVGPWDYLSQISQIPRLTWYMLNPPQQTTTTTTQQVPITALPLPSTLAGGL
jgi:hypothetical protein